MKYLNLYVLVLTILFSNIIQAANCIYNCPTGSSGPIIERTIYTLQNNNTSKLANWVAYKVTNTTIDGPSRNRNWKADPDIYSGHTLEPSDYTDANAFLGTDRGHQVPLASFSNTSYWATTNYLSNVTPQNSDLNQGAWVKLETAVRDFARTGQDVYVVTGPLYEWYFGTLPNANEMHDIPSGYFKVVITDNSGWVEASAYIMEQDLSRSEGFCSYEVTVNEVENRTGMNIMPTLPFYKESSVEGQTGGLTTELGC